MPSFNPFSWSLRRRNMLKRCPREYFYHYYGAAGGAFVRSFTHKAEKLHLLRALLEKDEYVRKVISAQIRRLFYSGAAVPGDFTGALEEQFRREFQDMLRGRAEADHKRPLLRELFVPGVLLRELEEKVTASLKSEGGNFEKGALTELLRIPAENRLFLPCPLNVCWNSLDCYLIPVAAWLDGGRFCVVCNGTASEENQALLSFYALEKFRLPPEKIHIFHFEENKLSPAPPLASFSAALQRIREDADQMLALELQLKCGKSAALLFPQEHKMCLNCRFCSFCSELSQH